MSIRCDRLLLELTSRIFRRVSWLPGRILKWLGFELFTLVPYSQRWARLGTLPVRLGRTGPWLHVDIGYAQQRYLYLTAQNYKSPVSGLISRFVRPGSCYVDIGANIGIHVVHAAAIVGTKGLCLAFEPNPEVFRILEGQIRINRMDNVAAHNLALGAVPGRCELRVPSFRVSGEENVSTSLLGTLRSGTQSTNDLSWQVDVVRGDDALKGIPERMPGLCKIDVEGYELEVVKGMSGFISAHPNVTYCIEVTDRWIRQASGVGSEELLRCFRELGFVAYKTTRQGRLVRLDECAVEGQVDVFFMHRNCHGA